MRRLVLGALALLGLALGAAPATAQPAKAGTTETEHSIESWRKQIHEARLKLQGAQARRAAAEAAYRNARRRGHPRGEARAEMLAELQEARIQLQEARDAIPQLNEEARRAGVPPGVLRELAEAEESR